MGKLKIGACALCAVVSIAMFNGSFVANANDSISDKQQQVNEIREANEKRQKEIDALGDNISDNETAMKLIGEQIDGYLAEIAAYGELVTEKQAAVENKKAEIELVEKGIADKEAQTEAKRTKITELEAQNKLNLEQYGKLARYMYMNNISSQLPILNGSDDWYGYLVYSDVVNNITKQNADFMDGLLASIELQKDMIAELNGEIESLENEKAELEQERAYLEQQEAELWESKYELEKNAEEKRQKLYALAAENDAFLAKISGLKSDIEGANELMEELNAQIEEEIRKAQANRDPEMPDYSGEELQWPLDPKHHTITCYFVDYDAFHNGRHTGIDISDGGIRGEPILAAQSGVVVTVSNTCTHNEPKRNWTCGCGGNYGNYIIIDHGGQLATLYGHCQAIYVSPGQVVEKGQAIGAVGSTGWSSWWHLHFETRENGVRVNPNKYLNF